MAADTFNEHTLVHNKSTTNVRDVHWQDWGFVGDGTATGKNAHWILMQTACRDRRRVSQEMRFADLNKNKQMKHSESATSKFWSSSIAMNYGEAD